MKFSSALSCIGFIVLASTVGSSAEFTQDQRAGVTSAEEDVTSGYDATIPDVPPQRELLKKKKGPKRKKTKAPKSTKKPKAPKSEKKPKSAKGLATASPTSQMTSPQPSPTSQMTSSQPSLQPSSPPTDDPCVVEGISTHKDALLAFKDGFTYGSTVLGDWDIETDPCDDNWTGLTCNSDGEVTKILIDSKSLEGTISPLIGCPTTTLVSTLTHLNFSNNGLTGTIPTELGALTNLENLNLHTNELTGTIPMELGALTKMQYLFFYDNKLDGTIPSDLGQLTNLKILSFYTNQLTGTIPMELGALTNLEIAYFNDNDLEGSMPTEICYLRNNASGAISILHADRCGSTPEVVCDSTCCNNSC